MLRTTSHAVLCRLLTETQHLLQQMMTATGNVRGETIAKAIKSCYRLSDICVQIRRKFVGLCNTTYSNIIYTQPSFILTWIQSNVDL